MINNSTYFFGLKSGRYFQYPLDSLNSVFGKFESHFEAESQIAIHREDDLMYYAYMRKMVQSKSDSYFGICLIVNGVRINNISRLFRLFENAIQSIALEGNVIEVTEDGFFSISDITDITLHSEYSRVIDIVNRGISEVEKYFEKLSDGIVNNNRTVLFNEEEINNYDKICDQQTIYVSKNQRIGNPSFNGLVLKYKQLNERLKFQMEMNLKLERMLENCKVNTVLSKIGIVLIIFFILLSIITSYLVVNRNISFNF